MKRDECRNAGLDFARFVPTSRLFTATCGLAMLAPGMLAVENGAIDALNDTGMLIE